MIVTFEEVLKLFHFSGPKNLLFPKNLLLNYHVASKTPYAISHQYHPPPPPPIKLIFYLAVFFICRRSNIIYLQLAQNSRTKSRTCLYRSKYELDLSVRFNHRSLHKTLFYTLFVFCPFQH